MTYRKNRRRKPKDPITGKSLRWQARNIPEFLDEQGHFAPEKWYPTNEPAPLADFVFHPSSQAAIIGVSVGYLEPAVADPRFHYYRIGPIGTGIRATTGNPTGSNSGGWFGSVRGQEARARQSQAGREKGVQNLTPWAFDTSSGSGR